MLMNFRVKVKLKIHSRRLATDNGWLELIQNEPAQMVRVVFRIYLFRRTKKTSKIQKYIVFDIVKLSNYCTHLGTDTF